MPESEEPGFQVVDKRRVGRASTADEDASGSNEEASSGVPPGTSEGETSTAADAEPAGGQTEAEQYEGEDGDDGGQTGPTSVIDLAQMCVGMMNEVAWVKLGLVPDPMTGALGADLTQARLAIDCAADIVHRLETHVDPKSHRDLQVLVQNLKMNYVRKSAG